MVTGELPEDGDLWIGNTFKKASFVKTIGNFQVNDAHFYGQDLNFFFFQLTKKLFATPEGQSVLKSKYISTPTLVKVLGQSCDRTNQLALLLPMYRASGLLELLGPSVVYLPMDVYRHSFNDMDWVLAGYNAEIREFEQCKDQIKERYQINLRDQPNDKKLVFGYTVEQIRFLLHKEIMQDVVKNPSLAGTSTPLATLPLPEEIKLRVMIVALRSMYKYIEMDTNPLPLPKEVIAKRQKVMRDLEMHVTGQNFSQLLFSFKMKEKV